MIKLYLGSFALLTAGLLAGIFLSGTLPEATLVSPLLSGTTEAGATEAGAQPPTAALQDRQARVRIAELEAEVTAISARLNLMESRNLNLDDPAETGAAPTEDISVSGGGEPVAVTEGLIAAGLDTFSAEQIARRVSESELRRLELRDKAIREGYMGTAQYREEMNAARESQIRIRDEVDESTYDKYLYYSGQSNRVAVSSVMLGSAAEESGLQTGDVLLRYEDDALYRPGDLRGLTTQGERDELVDLTLLREGNQMSVSIPRGPLGVRISAVRINPEED